jgi:hypothetical protein
VFYHLPPRQNQEIGHASDLVFKLKQWTREDKYWWDEAEWSRRLDMYGIDEKCFGRSLIVWLYDLHGMLSRPQTRLIARIC